MRAWYRLAEQGELGRAIRLADRQVLFGRGDDARAAYFLVNGYVEIYQELPDGRSIVVRVLTPPCVFGVLETCGDEPRYLESVRALGPAVVHRIDQDRFHAILRDDRGAALECLATTAMAFCRVATTETARLVDTEALLAGLMLAWIELFGERTDDGIAIRLRRSQVDLAGAVGTSERHIQRMLAVWKQRGLVSTGRGRYLVRRRDVLAGIAGDLGLGLLHRVEKMPTWVYLPGGTQGSPGHHPGRGTPGQRSRGGV